MRPLLFGGVGLRLIYFHFVSLFTICCHLFMEVLMAIWYFFSRIYVDFREDFIINKCLDFVMI